MKKLTEVLARFGLILALWPANQTGAVNSVEIEQNLVAVIVNTDLAPAISVELNQFVSDLQDEGYRVVLETSFDAKKSVEDLRNWLKNKLSQGLIGAELIGDLPVPLMIWKEEGEGYHSKTPRPEDFIYADLNGRWLDEDGDKVYGYYHRESAVPDSILRMIYNSPAIWVGRLTFSTITSPGKDEVFYLKQYFAKNHQWRKNLPRENKKGLYYSVGSSNDENYSGNARSVLNLIFKEVDIINSLGSQVPKQDFISRLQDPDYEIISFSGHGWSDAQGLDIDATGRYEYTIFSQEILDLQPQARFYNFYHSGFGDYTEKSIGTSYLASGNGLAVFNALHSPEEPEQLYESLAQGQTLGEAYQKIWRRTFSPLLGDPTLRIVDAGPFPIVPQNIPAGLSLNGQLYQEDWKDGTYPGLSLKWKELGFDFAYQVERTCLNTGEKQVFLSNFRDRRFLGEFFGFVDHRLKGETTYSYRVRSRFKDETGWKYSQWSESIIVTTPDGSTAVAETAPLPFSLGNAFPNPFNPSTTITYNLVEAGEAKLEIYNLAGQKVATLVQGWQTAGQHSIFWNASGFSSGLYFYTLKTNQGILTKKVVLLK